MRSDARLFFVPREGRVRLCPALCHGAAMLHCLKLQARLGHGGSDAFRSIVPLEADVPPPLADVQLPCADGVVWAHRALLCARSRFYAELLPEQRAVHELPPLPVRAAALLAVLRFLYTDVVHFSWDSEDVALLREHALLATKMKLPALQELFQRNMASAAPVAARVTSLWADLGAVLGVSGDVVLVVEGRPFLAHRAVLVAQSSFFDALFTHGWRESAHKGDEMPSIALGGVRAEDFEAVCVDAA